MSPPAAPATTHLIIDRDLGVPVGAQLRGQIEYGIACGDLARGSRLPSVRELAQELGLAHVTVAQVYKELLTLGLIVTVHGRGTFVADAPALPDQGPLLALLRQTLDRAEAAGYSGRQVSETLTAMLSRRAGRDVVPRPGGVTVALIGLFVDATGGYAADLGALLEPQDRVLPVTLEALRRGEELAAVRGAEVVLTVAHRFAEAQALLPGQTVLPVGFIPADQTRTALAQLEPLTRLAVVSTFEEFLPTFLGGVRRFAPHVSEVRGVSLASAELPALLAWCGVVVYASGSGDVCARAGGRACFEYRHTLDPRDITQLVLPAVQACRSGAGHPAPAPHSAPSPAHPDAEVPMEVHP